MVEHMVWFKFKPNVSQERIEHHMQGLAGLKDRIPVIVDLKLGQNFTDRSNGFTHGLIVTLKCRDCLQTYSEHPDHVAVAKPLREDAEIMAMDFEH